MHKSVFIIMPMPVGKAGTHQQQKAKRLVNHFERMGYVVFDPYEIIHRLELSYNVFGNTDPERNDYLKEFKSNIDSCSSVLISTGSLDDEMCIELITHAKQQGKELLGEMNYIYN